jgi:uncharacterized protein YqgV (UPF0045/DUF77 family)
MENVENNKLIAEFMGLYPEETLKGDSVYAIKECHSPNKLNDIKTNFYSESELKFHFSWDWLMPVVEKIEELGIEITIGRMYCDIKYKDVFDKEKVFEIRIVSGVKINAVNGAVIKLVKWYNANK